MRHLKGRCLVWCECMLLTYGHTGSGFCLAVIGAVQAAWDTSKPEILGEEGCQKVDYLEGSPWRSTNLRGLA